MDDITTALTFPTAQHVRCTREFCGPRFLCKSLNGFNWWCAAEGHTEKCLWSTDQQQLQHEASIHISCIRRPHALALL